MPSWLQWIGEADRVARTRRAIVVVGACLAAVFLVRGIAQFAVLTWHDGRNLRSYELQLETPDFDNRPLLEALGRLAPDIPTSRVAVIITSRLCDTCEDARTEWNNFARRAGLVVASIDVTASQYLRSDERYGVLSKDLFAITTGLWVTPSAIVIDDVGRVSCVVRGAPTGPDLQPCETSIRERRLFMRDVGHSTGLF